MKFVSFNINGLRALPHQLQALVEQHQPVAVRRVFPGDAQRRLIVAEIPSPISDITVINGYFPQGESRDHPTKFPAKEKFYRDLQRFLTEDLPVNKPVLIMGNMNISSTDLDIGIGEESRKR